MDFDQNTHAKASFWLHWWIYSKFWKQCTQTDVVVLDFSKVFDVVPHWRLLYKLDKSEIRETNVNWIQRLLTSIEPKK